MNIVKRILKAHAGRAPAINDRAARGPCRLFYDRPAGPGFRAAAPEDAA